MDAVCFDMDGVLVDSEDYWVPYEAGELFPRLGLDDLDVDGITGMNYREIYEYLVERYEIEMDREEFLSWYDEPRRLSTARKFASSTVPRAGIHVVGFRHGRSDETDRSRADFVADSPASLREHLLARADGSA